MCDYTIIIFENSILRMIIDENKKDLNFFIYIYYFLLFTGLFYTLLIEYNIFS